MNGYKVIADRFSVTNPMGLDLRCAHMLVQTALQFDAEFEVKYRRAAVDGKSLLNVLSLGVDCGSVVDVNIYGREAPQAHEAIQFLFNHAFASDVLPETSGIAVA